MHAVGMLVEIEDALLLHQPADEVEGALAVLHAIHPRGVAACGGVAVVLEPQVVEHGCDDFNDRLLLEDFAAALLAQLPQPGTQDRAVVGEARIAADLGEARDHAVEVAGPAARQFDGDRGGLADDIAEGERAVAGDEVELEAERLGQRLLAGQRPEQQLVLAKRRGDGEVALILGIVRQSPYPSPAPPAPMPPASLTRSRPAVLRAWNW